MKCKEREKKKTCNIGANLTYINIRLLLATVLQCDKD